MKIRFKTNDDLPLNQITNIPVCAVIMSSIFKEDNKYHPQVSFSLFKFAYKMTTKQMNIKNRTYYFYNDLINIKDFEGRLLKLDKETSMCLGIYCIAYVTKNLSIKLIV